MRQNDTRHSVERSTYITHMLVIISLYLYCLSNILRYVQYMSNVCPMYACPVRINTCSLPSKLPGNQPTLQHNSIYIYTRLGRRKPHNNISPGSLSQDTDDGNILHGILESWNPDGCFSCLPLPLALLCSACLCRLRFNQTNTRRTTNRWVYTHTHTHTYTYTYTYTHRKKSISMALAMMILVMIMTIVVLSQSSSSSLSSLYLSDNVT